MKRIPASIIVFLTTIAPAVAAETTERTESLPDANPACMQRDGPDCILRSQDVPPPTAGPRDVTVVPTPAPTIITAPGTPTVIAPAPTTAPRDVTVVPTPAPTITTAPGTPTVIAPPRPAQPSTIISPRP